MAASAPSRTSVSSQSLPATGHVEAEDAGAAAAAAAAAAARSSPPAMALVSDGLGNSSNSVRAHCTTPDGACGRGVTLPVPTDTTPRSQRTCLATATLPRTGQGYQDGRLGQDGVGAVAEARPAAR